MADTFTIKAGDVLDQMATVCPPPPPVPGLNFISCETAIGVLKGMIGGLSVTLPSPQALLDEVAEWKEKAEDLQQQLGALGSGTPATGGPPVLPGGDPMEPLRRLAEAINEAENRLNQQNLVIASGSAEVSLVIEVGGAAAQANIRLDIQPRPFQ